MSDEKKPEEQAPAPEAAEERKADAAGGSEPAAAAQPELAEAAAEVGRLTPEARASKTPLSAETQAAVDAAAEKQAADPAAQTTSEPSDAPAAEIAAAPAGAAADAAAERAAARAARQAARAAAAGDAPAADAAAGDDEKAAKAKAAAEARAARASSRAAKDGDAEPAAPKEPSPNQPLLDRLVAILKDSAGEDAVVESFINERDGHRPYVVIQRERWPQAAAALKNHEELKCDYLRNLAGVDQETHLEVAYHLLSIPYNREYCVKVKTDRDQPSIPSVTPVWPTANWNEREVYDLLGVDFPGHPDLRRIMMPDDWVGHPLRKDYEPLDPEV